MRTRSISWIRTWLSVTGLFVLFLAGLSACGASTNTTSGKPIVIGTSLSTSGDFKADGTAMQQGYQLWADTVNNGAGVLGRPVTLDILSDNSTPDQVTANYEKLITKDHVDLLFGPFSSLLTKSAACVAAKYGYPLLEGAGGGPSVFTLRCDNGTPVDPGVNKGVAIHNIFDVSLPVQSNLDSFALYVLSLPVGERPLTAAYATEDDPFTTPQVVRAKQLLEAGGVKTVYFKIYDPTKMKTQDYQQIAQAIMKTKAEVGVFGTLLPDITAFVKSFRSGHYGRFKAVVATAGPDLGPQFEQAVGGPANAEAIFVPNGWYPTADNYQNISMVATYVAQYHVDPAVINSDVAEGYSVGQVLAQATAKIQSIDNKQLLNELHGKDIFNSVQGTVKFDATGQNTAALAYLFQWQGGALIPVFPDNAAVAVPESNLM